MYSLQEALEHPQPHIRAQARIIKECEDIDIKSAVEILVRELDEWKKHLEREKN